MNTQSHNNESKPSFFQKMDPKYTIVAIILIIVTLMVLFKTKKPSQKEAEAQQWKQIGDGMQNLFLEGNK